MTEPAGGGGWPSWVLVVRLHTAKIAAHSSWCCGDVGSWNHTGPTQATPAGFMVDSDGSELQTWPMPWE